MATAAQLFASEGKLAFLMTLSNAAAHLRDRDERPGDHVDTIEVVANNVNGPTAPFQSDAFDAVKHQLQLLDAADMPSLKPVASGDPDYPAIGLEGGIYTNLNGAALVARSDDALFVSFRGSNDIDGDFDIGSTPDSSQWDIDERPKHYKLFARLDAAIKIYRAEHPEITKIYITGHSLGGGMVNAFMQSHSSSIYEGVSFGSIRYGETAGESDPRITNVWNDNDVALAFGGRADGAPIRFKVAGPDPISAHMPWLYTAEIKFLADHGYDIDSLTGWSRIVFSATPHGLFGYSIGVTADRLNGSSGRDLMFGGALGDRLQGFAGRDRIDGGSGLHDVAVYSEKSEGVSVTLNGAHGADVLVGGHKEDFIVNIEGVDGGHGRDSLVGDAKGNQFDGNTNRDSLDGQAGADTLDGGSGNDTLTGGAHDDRFVFSASAGVSNADHITDFVPRHDVIALDHAVFSRLGAMVNAVEFYAAAGARAGHDKSDRIIYDTDTGKLFYDADGSRTGYGPKLFAIIDGAPTLHPGDFLIV